PIRAPLPRNSVRAKPYPARALLVRGGEVRRLDRPEGMLLGASTDPVYTAAECRLEPGDRLLMYTDGLVERPGEDIDTGLSRLADAVRTAGPGSLDALLDALLEGERRDDVCVLDIRVPMPDEDGSGDESGSGAGAGK
ncbi:SpoIIE family protein phosphatase, partial [Streptomyces sp. NPDC005921]